MAEIKSRYEHLNCYRFTFNQTKLNNDANMADLGIRAGEKILIRNNAPSAAQQAEQRLRRNSTKKSRAHPDLNNRD